MVSVRDVVEEFMKKGISNWTWYTIREHDGKQALFIHDKFVTYTSADSLDDEISEKEAERIRQEIENWIKTT